MAGMFVNHEDVTQPLIQHLDDKLPETWPECDRIDYSTRPEPRERQDSS